MRRALAQAIPGGTLDPSGVAKFVTPLVKPPVLPRKGKINAQGMKNAEYYEIAMKEFLQQILPNVPGVPLANHPMTTVWSYGPADKTPSLANRYFYPAFTIENKWRKPTVVKWVNGLDPTKPHILPVDPTLHWASPIGARDTRPDRDPSDAYWSHGLLDPTDGRYIGPVPMVTHVHGAHTHQESDGYPEAWYLPAGATGVNWTAGTYFDIFDPGDGSFGAGFAEFAYPNDQRATTLWYHDHTLGMTRLNVYAGPAGFYLIRGGPDDQVGGVLPGPAPGVGDDPAFFEGLTPGDFTDPNVFIPGNACGGFSDVAPIWQPEFFGNMMVVNGQTWPFLEVEPQLYRFRLLNGCNSRFLVLEFENPAVKVWQIGADGGFLPAPVLLNDNPPDGSTPGGTAKLLMGPAERADVIVDFRGVTPGSPSATFRLLNLGPDEPFGGFPTPASDAASTGQVMEFRVLPPGPMSALPGAFSEPGNLVLPAITPPVLPGGPYTNPRPLSLNEEESATVKVLVDANGDWITPVVLACGDPNAVPFGPTAALLGTYDPATGVPTPMMWSENVDPISENPAVGSTETWEIYNFTADAHPIHIHLVQFQVVDRQPLAPLDADGVATPPAFPTGTARGPEAGETGFKDTLIVYPGEVARVQARFDIPGRYVWHCHIVEHEDNEMMRPYRVGP